MPNVVNDETNVIFAALHEPLGLIAVGTLDLDHKGLFATVQICDLPPAFLTPAGRFLHCDLSLRVVFPCPPSTNSYIAPRMVTFADGLTEDNPCFLLADDSEKGSVHVFDTVAGKHIGYVGDKESMECIVGISASINRALVAVCLEVQASKRSYDGFVRLYGGRGACYEFLRIVGAPYGAPLTSSLHRLECPRQVAFSRSGRNVVVYDRKCECVTLFATHDGSFIKHLATGIQPATFSADLRDVDVDQDFEFPFTGGVGFVECEDDQWAIIPSPRTCEMCDDSVVDILGEGYIFRISSRRARKHTFHFNDELPDIAWSQASRVLFVPDCSTVLLYMSVDGYPIARMSAVRIAWMSAVWRTGS